MHLRYMSERYQLRLDKSESEFLILTMPTLLLRQGWRALRDLCVLSRAEVSHEYSRVRGWHRREEGEGRGLHVFIWNVVILRVQSFYWRLRGSPFLLRESGWYWLKLNRGGGWFVMRLRERAQTTPRVYGRDLVDARQVLMQEVIVGVVALCCVWVNKGTR